ncbi:ankyrin repeat-containing domain protein [Neocallimastix lanati (nom. inval.)]|nr:ankyrin repeat-containing domain protein [Neocallimastix sp. JGI-2020a]
MKFSYYELFLITLNFMIMISLNIYFININIKRVCHEEKENIIKFLIRNGANVNNSNKDRKTPLGCKKLIGPVIYLYLWHTKSGNENLVKYLVEIGADYGETPLFDACYSGNENLVKYLVENGVDINKKNRWAKTPLFIACEKRNEKIINYLVEQGADVNEGNNWAETPLHNACNNENEDMIKYLVENGADINKKDRWAKAPLLIACNKENENIIKYLVEKGADINTENEKTETPLLVACRNGNENIIKYLVEHGADIYKVIDILNCPIKRYVPRRGLSKKKGYIKKLLVELKDNTNDNKKYKRKLVTYKDFKITKKNKNK